jgi:hypothetical protein
MQGRLSNVFQNNICNIHHSHAFQHETLHSFRLRSPTRLKPSLYMRTTPKGSSSHVLKGFSLLESLTKDYKVYT